jgi:hypothetical protein
MNRKVTKSEEVFIQTIIDTTKTPLADGQGEEGTVPDISDDCIWLNGVGEDSHETLAIGTGETWNFCKTARKPYDTVVVAILSYLHDQGAITWRSDGEASYGDFKKGKALKSRVKAKINKQK